MHPTHILATFSNISGRPKDMVKSEKKTLAILPLNGYIPMSFHWKPCSKAKNG